MKNKIMFMILGVIIIIGVLSWQFFLKFDHPSTKIKESSPSKFEDEKAHGHNHNHMHGHHEDHIIEVSSGKIKELGIQTKEAGPGELTIALSTRGKIIIHPDKLAHILPKVSGVARWVGKNIGDDVKKDEILAVLESREIADIKANYLAAQEKEKLALLLFTREERLYQKKISAEQDYLNAKSSYEETKINVQLAKQKLRAFGLTDEEIEELAKEDDPDLRLNEIRSPMDGTVVFRHITKGEFIENTATIFEIADLTNVWIEIGIYPKDLNKVKEGQLVDVSLPSDEKTSPAKIIYLSPIIQDETITAKAIAEMNNPNGKWRPGSFVKVNIATEKINVPIAVPKEAIQEIEGDEYIFVRVPEGFEKRRVQTGKTDNANVEILSGLNQGEEYASSKTFLLKADLSKEDAEHTHD